jgi:alkylated DNA nucleotide flippase Atl1
MKWQDLVVVLARHVPAGKITTYAEVSEWGYGRRTLNQPVRSLLRGALNNGFGELTNRVVGSDGELADLPEGSEQQRRQLEAEGISFNTAGAVDLRAHRPVVLANGAGAA